jgi:hypothetical protein
VQRTATQYPFASWRGALAGRDANPAPQRGHAWQSLGAITPHEAQIGIMKGDSTASFHLLPHRSRIDIW